MIVIPAIIIVCGFLLYLLLRGAHKLEEGGIGDRIPEGVNQSVTTEHGEEIVPVPTEKPPRELKQMPEREISNLFTRYDRETIKVAPETLPEGVVAHIYVLEELKGQLFVTYMTDGGEVREMADWTFNSIEEAKRAFIEIYLDVEA